MPLLSLASLTFSSFFMFTSLYLARTRSANFFLLKPLSSFFCFVHLSTPSSATVATLLISANFYRIFIVVAAADNKRKGKRENKQTNMKENSMRNTTKKTCLFIFLATLYERVFSGMH